MTLAEAAGGAGMVASGHLMDAIRDLRNLRDTKERRSELEVKLRQAQAQIRDEMGVFSTEVDLTDRVNEASRVVGGASLASAIWEFVNLSKSPTPEELRDAVEQQAQDHPISAMMPRSIHDDDNKVVANSPGYIGNEADDDAIRPLIAQLESTRRRLDAAGLIEPARCTIHAEHGLISGPECHGPDSVYACWFVFRLCCLPLGPSWQQVAERLDTG